ncbi:MAG: hypothetical protein LUQ22_07520 [Methanotrichaceae archaeon]|nr:hypothetical protein [Methanotrichaceae archaeon]
MVIFDMGEVPDLMTLSQNVGLASDFWLTKEPNMKLEVDINNPFFKDIFFTHF